MSYMDEYNKLKKKRLGETKTYTKATNSGVSSYMNEYNRLRGQGNTTPLSSAIRPSISLSKKNKDEDEEKKKDKEKEAEKEKEKEAEKAKESEPKRDERKWFQKGAFEDGYQFGDLTKTIFASGEDAETNIWSGILGIPEKILDAGMTLGTAMNQGSMMQAANTEIVHNAIFGNKESASTTLQRYQDAQDEAEKATAEFVAKDLYDEKKVANKIISGKNYQTKKVLGYDAETDSVFGDKSDSLMQSGGQLLAQIGVNAIAPGSGMALMATTAFGSEAENAFNNGATFDEALLSSTISAGAEILTERLGGISFGGKTLTDAAFEGLSRKMTSKIAKVLITSGKVATDMTAEGAEEILSGYMSAIGQKLTYMEDKEIEELFSSEDMLESFIGGAVLGGAGGVGGVVQANAKGVDYVTGLTKNEQAVANKVYETELARKEESGKVSSREKTKLYNKVLKDMEAGRIDTDTIESVLGGESYDSYQSMVEQETSLKKQSESLTKEINTILDKGNPTIRDNRRLAEAEKELEQVKSALGSIDTKTAKSNLFSEVDKLTANDTKLRESYNEKTRRGQAFEADLTKYDAKQQETIKKAVESGILNNTNRTHEFVDLVAKISADKGVPFDFTNNQKLKETGFVIDGKQVNGYVTKDGITLNVNSSKSLDTVVGHEITHVLEGTELYNELQNAVVEYAKSKNDYQGRYDALTKLYENVEGANIDSELTAELVGDYLFTDTDFINNLSTNNRNVFEKVYDEVKYMLKVATAGSKEARELEKVKKVFEEAYRAETKNTADSGVRYSLDIKHSDGTVERLANARNLTSEKAVEYLYQAKSGELRRDTYVPVRKNTPQVLIDTLEQVNDHIENLSMVMNVDKAQRAMAVENTGTKTKKYGDNVRKHGLSPEEIVAVINNLDNPTTVIYQTNRQDKQGNPLPNSVAVFVEYNVDGREGMAAVEFENPRNTDAIGEEFGETNYHTVITVFEPDVERNGMPFDYAEELLSDPNNYELEIKRRQADESATGEKHPNTSNELPSSAVNVAEEGSNVKPQYSLREEADTKQKQLEIINETNPMWDDYHTGIRSVEDIRTWEEVLALDDDSEGQFAWGDFSREDAENALKNNSITVYSSYPIINGTFVSTSYIQAWEYAGGNKNSKVYSEKVPLDHVAWINGDEGQYAKVDSAYSAVKDSNGNQLSKEQQERFKDSKIRDENGNLKVVYHGTPNGDYSIFKEGTYFTDNKAYADRYQNPGASSISSGKTASNPKTFEVYLDIKKPFDLNDAEAKRIYIEEYIKGGNALGINPYLSDAEYAKIETIDWTEGEDLRDFLIENEYDYDGLVLDEGADGGYGEDVQYRGKSYVIFNPEQAKSVDNTNPTNNPDINLSLSEKDVAPTGRFLGKDIALETAPVAETTDAKVAEPDIAPVAEAKVENYAPGESLEEQLSKADESLESLDSEIEALFRDYAEQKVSDEDFQAKWKDLDKRTTQARQEQERLSAEMTDINNRKYESLDDSDIPPEAEAPYYGDAESIAPVDPFAERDMSEVGKRNVKAYMYENPEVKPFFQDAARGMLYDLHNGTKGERIFNEKLHYESGYEEGWMGTSRRTTGDIADLLDQWGYTYKQIEDGLNAIIEDNGKENNAVSKRIEFMLDNRLRNGYKDVDGRPIPSDEGYINLLKEKQIDAYRSESFDSFMEVADQYAPPAEDIAPLKIEPAVEGEQNVLDEFEQTEQAQTEQAPERLTRAKLHKQIVDRIKSVFTGKGIDFDKVLDDAHRMNALSINDNTPQRVNDKTFGYEAGEVLNDLTFNRVALDESNGIKWENEQVGTLRNLSKKYKIKPRSKEAAAVQMYAEGFWVNEKDEIIAYGDAELAKDFPDVQVQNRIKALANDPTIRKIYDDTLSAINESRRRNGYPEIPRLDNYFLHYRAQTDTFSQLGVPFNPNDIKAKDLPTDINGTTIDRKPGQPFFASSMHREGKRTTFDVFDGLERYIHSAKNQIYHIDNIQTARALWGYIADRYGQAHGLENLDDMAFEAQQEHIQKVYDGHLSNYARFLVEYANNLAGKTALIDRGVEGLLGRRALQFINTVNTQAGRNQVGYSVSSPLTNFIPSMEAIARTSKRDSIKAFAQTVSNVFHKDGFVESDPTLIRRKGADKFSKTLWEKMSDPGYILMGAVDNVTSEFIVRTKYNELTRKGMDSKQAHIKAGEWASRVMGDRSLGQTPLLYNSKFMGLFTKYQLEVRNQLDSAFYDNIQEIKASTKDIENQLEKNTKTAAKIASKTLQIAVLNHVFGMAFEKIAGYNPAFDIISTIATLFGWDDDEDDEDTFGDNAEQAFKELLGDLPYTSLITDGGRIPAGSALPIKQLVTGVDKYGNEKSRWETIAEAAPYYLLPGGYSQIKKTTQGLGMFSEEHPVSGSYTDSGNLRFPVEKTFGNVLQAGLFGQYASENARDYFDNERSPLKEKQIQEYIDVELPIKDYWEYREGLAKQDTLEEKFDYIAGLDLPVEKKNILINNIVDRKEKVDLEGYEDFSDYEEFDFAIKHPEKWEFMQANNISYTDYNASEESREAYSWAAENPEKYVVSKAVADDVVTYRQYASDLYDIRADKDSNGKTINGSAKAKKIEYINSLPLDYGQKIILFKSQYKSDDSVNMDIIEYLDSREDIDYEQMVTILTELGFTVNGNNVYWD